MTNARFNSITRGFKVEFSFKDLPLNDRLDLLNSILTDTGITTALIESFGLEPVSEVIEKAFKAYSEKG